ncbi:MAG TPA: DUF192 domain-containing protein [Usitatibacter sp.]|jgi:hypothetical protein|nr:DUF192 domain-containing protein [Usitatibacter sp.]
MQRPSDIAPAARFLAIAAFAVACWSAAAADIAFKTSNVKVGPHPLKVELAVTEEQRERGLMFRKALGRDEGMVFVFDEPAYQSMWMKNTLIPLSVAFLDGDGRILNILDMQPETLDTHTSAGPARYAIESNIGWFERNKVKAGDKVTGLPPLPR